jgi:apolipoprotein N-acyltransferase
LAVGLGEGHLDTVTENTRRSALLRLARFWPWLAAAASGGLLAICFPPAGVGGVSFVALIPLLCGVWIARPTRRGGLFRFGLGYVAGLVFFTATFHWLAELGPLYESKMLLGLPLLLAAYLALYPAVWAWFAGWLAGDHFKPLPPPDPLAPFERPALLKSGRNLGISVLLAAAWVGLEWVRGWMLSGFGWNTLGVALYRDLPLIQIVEFTGVGGLSFLLVMCNAIGLITVLRLRAEIGRIRLRPHFDFAVTVALVALNFGYGVRVLFGERAAGKDGVSLRVAVVQPNIPQSWKFDFNRSDDIVRRMQELSELAALTSPDLLLWPEAAVPGGLLGDQAIAEFVREQTALVPAMMLGTDDLNRSGPGDDHNSAALLLAGQAEIHFYDKRHLVPFGEYLPLRFLLDPIAGHLVPGDFKPGAAPGVFSLVRPALKVAPLICFEDTLGGVTREPVLLGAQVLVNLTNDGWFGRSCAAEQHFANAVFRAVENRCLLLRCTNTGVTASVDRFGRVDRWLEPFSMGVASRQFTVPLETPRTFYTRNGDVFSVACAALALAAIAIRFALKRRGRASRLSAEGTS